MNELDLRDEDIIWWSREPYPIFRINKNKVLNQKYILKNDLNIQGNFDVKIMIGEFYRLIKDAEVETIEGHTVITKYV